MSSFIADLATIIERDLLKLREEIQAYPNEESLWIIQGEITNSAGNLCLHLCGNLQHFIGHVLGGSSFVRNRDLEFSARHIPTAQLLEGIDATMQAVSSTLTTLDASILEQEFPLQIFGYPMSTGYFLLHLATHLEYHLGQINYHRRLLATQA